MIIINKQIKGQESVDVNALNFPRLFYTPCDPRREPVQMTHLSAEIVGDDIDVQTDIPDADALKVALETRLTEKYARSMKMLESIKSTLDVIEKHFPNVINTYKDIML